jgi:hypothetical protein
MYKDIGSDQIPLELIQVGEISCSEIHILINSVWKRKNRLIIERSLLLYQFTWKVIKLTVVIIGGYHCYQLHKNVSNMLLSRLTPYIVEIIGDHQCVFRVNRSTTDQNLRIRQIQEKKWEYSVVHQLFVGHDSVRREVLYNILIEFGTPMKLVRLIKMCLNETYSKVRIGNHLFDDFPVQNGLKQDALSALIFKCADQWYSVFPVVPSCVNKVSINHPFQNPSYKSCNNPPKPWQYICYIVMKPSDVKWTVNKQKYWITGWFLSEYPLLGILITPRVRRLEPFWGLH